MRATVKGNVVVAAIQGPLGGVAFAVIGVDGSLVWGVLREGAPAGLDHLPIATAPFVLTWPPCRRRRRSRTP